jgi:hypothetical protein
MSNDVPEMPLERWKKDKHGKLVPDFEELDQDERLLLERRERKFATASRERLEQERLHGVPEMPRSVEELEDEED